MNKIKQNKITFFLILSVIVITFSSLTILSLPVLFNYESKVAKIEKNFYQNFKLYLKSSGSISYKPFPKPHLLVENASLNLSKSTNDDSLFKTSNLKIYISLRDVYLRSFKNLISTEISDTNLNMTFNDLNNIRKHLYEKVNKPILFNNCKIFIRNKNKDVILISPLKKINYRINSKSKVKNFYIEGKVFGFNFKSDWKRFYEKPKNSFHIINFVYPSIEIKNFYKFENKKNFTGTTEIEYAKDKLQYELNFKDNKLKIRSPESKNINFNIDANILLNPFNFDAKLKVNNKKVENIIDNLILNLLSYDENYLGNINGDLIIEFNNLNNKLIKNGIIQLNISEKKIFLRKVNFELDKIGEINSNISFVTDQGQTKFFSKNHLIVNNHIEFAKAFQIGSKNTKKIKNMYFNLEKSIGETDFIISDIRVNNPEKKNNKSDKFYLVKNIQNLRSLIRNFID